MQKRIFKLFIAISFLTLLFAFGAAGYAFAYKNYQRRDTTPIAPKRDPIIKRIADSLESINGRLPSEKVYIHTDRPSYSIGDTIWFKAYVLDGATNLPSTLSNLLYVQMDDDSTLMVERISIRIKDGVGWGQIPLRKTQYLEKTYTLRAYTSWMQNFGYDHTFNQAFYFGTPIEDTWLVKTKTSITQVGDKEQINVSLMLNKAGGYQAAVALKDVAIDMYDKNHHFYSEEMRTGVDGSLTFSGRIKDKIDGRQIRLQITSLEQKDNNKTIQVPLMVSRSKKIDLQFLPEGGKLVAGVKSVLAFKAVGEDGRGTDVAGEVYDSKGFKVAGFKALHNGMGALEFTPKGDGSFGKMLGSINKAEKQETYTARITEPQGFKEEYQLPKVEAIGTVIHVDNPEGDADIKVKITGLDNMSADSSFHIVATAKGELCYSQKLAANQTELSIPKSLFPTGIGKITLFYGMTPLNERALFVDHQDQLRIKVTPTIFLTNTTSNGPV